MMLAAALFAVLALIGLAYQAATILAARRVMGKARPADVPAVPVSFLRPLNGDEPGLFEALHSGILQDYSGPIRHVFGVASPADPAIAVVERLRRAHPRADIVLVVDPRQHGSNRKISNLINMMAKSRGDVVVLADSDIVVSADHLRRLVNELAKPEIGAVSCLYRGRPADGGVWTRLATLGIDAHFLPNVSVGIGFGLASPCFGSTIALKRETLAQIGGLEAIADQLADDYALGNAVRRLGLAIAYPAMLVDHNCVHISGRALLEHELRWARTIRTINPAGHYGTLVTFPVAHGALAAAASGFAWPYLGVTAAVVAVRIGLFWRLAHRFGLKRDRIWLLPIRDLLSYAVFLGSLIGRRVTWRGARFDVENTGVMTASDPNPKPGAAALEAASPKSGAMGIAAPVSEPSNTRIGR